MREHLNDLEIRRREELQSLLEQGVNPYPYEFAKTHTSREIVDGFNDEQAEEYSQVAVAGRIMALRKMGKASFCHIQDAEGKIQAYMNKKLIDNYDNIKLYDIGDIVGVEGEVFRTQKGEVTIRVKKLELLCKSLVPIPIAKETVDEDGNVQVHDAFADKELRYRQRYLDLLVNPQVRDVFVKRARIISAMRGFF